MLTTTKLYCVADSSRHLINHQRSQFSEDIGARLYKTARGAEKFAATVGAGVYTLYIQDSWVTEPRTAKHYAIQEAAKQVGLVYLSN